jgi:GNAT superfamily N-acetyltransferase
VTGSTVIVRRGTPADADGIAALLDRAFGVRPRGARERLWRWRAGENPARHPDIPPFIVAEQHGAIVGAHGLVPLRVKVGDDIVTAACSCDFAVDPAARGSGMALKLQAMDRALTPLPMSTSANAVANRVTLALGGKELDSGKVKLIRPLSVSRVLRRRLPAGMPGRVAAARIAGALPDLALAAGRALRRPSMAGASLETVTRFDDAFDRLWNRVAATRPVAVVRDAAYLQWRYASYPFGGIETIALRRDDQVLGYVALMRLLETDGLRGAVILDLVSDPDEPRVDAVLASAAARRAAAAGAYAVSTLAPTTDTRRVLERRGFVSRESDRSPYTYKANRSQHAELLGDPANWLIGLGDGDAMYAYDTEIW